MTRPLRIFIELALTATFIVTIALAVLIWRVSTSPLHLDEFVPDIEAALQRISPDMSFKINTAFLTGGKAEEVFRSRAARHHNAQRQQMKRSAACRDAPRFFVAQSVAVQPDAQQGVDPRHLGSAGTVRGRAYRLQHRIAKSRPEPRIALTGSTLVSFSHARRIRLQRNSHPRCMGAIRRPQGPVDAGSKER
jgi:hypothetical protein